MSIIYENVKTNISSSLNKHIIHFTMDRICGSCESNQTVRNSCVSDVEGKKKGRKEERNEEEEEPSKCSALE